MAGAVWVVSISVCVLGPEGPLNCLGVYLFWVGGGGHVAQSPHRGWSFDRFLRFGLENGGGLFQYGGQQGAL